MVLCLSCCSISKDNTFFFVSVIPFHFIRSTLDVLNSRTKLRESLLTLLLICFSENVSALTIVSIYKTLYKYEYCVYFKTGCQ